MKLLLLLLVFVGVGFFVWVRVAKDDAAVWHVDPQTAKRGKRPNQYFLLPGADRSPAPEYEMSAAALATKFDAMAMGQADIKVLAGNASDLWVTYIQRSRLMRYPDYISVKFIALENDRSTLAIYSRSRFGRSDLGVNKARIKAWIKALG